MSWSLAVTHYGDLTLGSRGVNTVHGDAKLLQDLRCAVLEPMGTDELHPSYGSIIDGGTDTSGKYSPGVIGHPNDAVAAAFVRSEIQRIVKVYQAQQIARNAGDVAIYGKSTLTTDEALLAVADLRIERAMDNMLVTVTIETGNNLQSLPFAFGTS